MDEINRRKDILEYVTHDESISFSAKGVFAFLLFHYKHDDDNTVFNELRIYSCESSKEIKSALNELEERNYVVSKGMGEYEVNEELVSQSINIMESAISEIKKQSPNE